MRQARIVLTALFSVSCLPNKNLQATVLDPCGWQRYEVCITYSNKLWQKLGPRGHIRALVSTRAATSRPARHTAINEMFVLELRENDVHLDIPHLQPADADQWEVWNKGGRCGIKVGGVE